MSPLVLRRATASDVPAIVTLVERAYRGEPSRVGWTTEAELLDGQRTDPKEVEDLIASTRSQILVAHEGEAALGSMALTDEGDALYVGMFAVEPTAQSKGVGRAMLGEAERIGRALEKPRMRMTVIAQRPELLAWYARRGYRASGAIEMFPYGNPRFGEPKREDLYFVVLEKPLTLETP